MSDCPKLPAVCDGRAHGRLRDLPVIGGTVVFADAAETTQLAGVIVPQNVQDEVAVLYSAWPTKSLETPLFAATTFTSTTLGAKPVAIKLSALSPRL